MRRLLRTGLALAILTPLLPASGQETDEAEGTKPDEQVFALQSSEEAQPSEDALAALAMIDSALKEIDESIERNGNAWQFELGGRPLLIVTDPIAERMRIMSPIVPASALPPEMSLRLLQANYDSALDARYAVAQDLLWSVFIHNLTSLDKQEFQSGLLQVINVAENFGTTYSSGVVVFGGGDSQSIIQQQLEELQAEREERETI